MESQNKSSKTSSSNQTAGEQRIVIGNNVFIVENNQYFERKEVICSKYFKHNREQRDEVVHLSYYNNFLVRKKRLSVSARYYFTNRPYGDRIHVKATYDGNCIGNFGLLKSTIGAGTQGKWPTIKNEEWQLKINLDLEKNEKGYMHFYIEYFEKVTAETYYEKAGDSEK